MNLVFSLVLKSCDFRAGAARGYTVYLTCTKKSRLSSKSCQETANGCKGEKPIPADTLVHGYQVCQRSFPAQVVLGNLLFNGAAPRSNASMLEVRDWKGDVARVPCCKLVCRDTNSEPFFF